MLIPAENITVSDIFTHKNGVGEIPFESISKTKSSFPLEILTLFVNSTKSQMCPNSSYLEWSEVIIPAENCT